MERTIKFRGKMMLRDGWAYGMPLASRFGCAYMITETGQLSTDFIYSRHTIMQREESIAVDPKTVSQFTGLKDKNGVEIYEGDILKIDEGYPVEVRYEKIYASFGIWRKGWAFLHYFHEAVEPEDCEVIGNIHDNSN